MEHLATYSDLTLNEFCNALLRILELPEFKYDSENLTEWGVSKDQNLEINVSRPYEPGTLYEWDNTVPHNCNFGITIIKDGLEMNEIKEIGQLIANEFKTTVFYHRTWVSVGINVERNIIIENEL